MKKWIAILCAVAMLSLLCLTACGTPAETDEATGTESAATDAEEITIGVSLTPLRRSMQTAACAMANTPSTPFLKIPRATLKTPLPL